MKSIWRNWRYLGLIIDDNWDGLHIARFPKGVCVTAGFVWLRIGKWPWVR